MHMHWHELNAYCERVVCELTVIMGNKSRAANKHRLARRGENMYTSAQQQGINGKYCALCCVACGESLPKSFQSLPGCYKST